MHWPLTDFNEHILDAMRQLDWKHDRRFSTVNPYPKNHLLLWLEGDVSFQCSFWYCWTLLSRVTCSVAEVTHKRNYEWADVMFEPTTVVCWIQLNTVFLMIFKLHFYRYFITWCRLLKTCRSPNDGVSYHLGASVKAENPYISVWSNEEGAPQINCF